MRDILYHCAALDKFDGYSVLSGLFYAARRLSRPDSPKYSRQEIEWGGLSLIQDEFPEDGNHYVAYTDGSCDNMNVCKPGGAAYILLKSGEPFVLKKNGFTNTTNNRCEMIAVISVCNSTPKGGFLDIYTDSQYAIAAFVKGWGKKNLDLIALYGRCTAHLGGVRFHWVKGHEGDKYNGMADDLAFSAYRETCEEYHIPIGRRMYKTR